MSKTESYAWVIWLIRVMSHAYDSHMTHMCDSSYLIFFKCLWRHQEASCVGSHSHDSFIRVTHHDSFVRVTHHTSFFFFIFLFHLYQGIKELAASAPANIVSCICVTCLIHTCDSFISVTCLIHTYDSFIRVTHPYVQPIILFFLFFNVYECIKELAASALIHMTHSYDSLIWLIDMTHWYDSFIRLIHMCDTSGLLRLIHTCESCSLENGG